MSFKTIAQGVVPRGKRKWKGKNRNVKSDVGVYYAMGGRGEVVGTNTRSETYFFTRVVRRKRQGRSKEVIDLGDERVRQLWEVSALVYVQKGRQGAKKLRFQTKPR